MPSTIYRGLTLHYSDKYEFDTLVEEVFKQNTYYVDLPTQEPLVIDAGAHIGLATLYYKSLYPRATIYCIEPNPNNLELLTKNLEENSVTGVTILPTALVTDPLQKLVAFHVHPHWGVFGSIHQGSWTGDQETKAIEVRAMTLSTVLDEALAKTGRETIDLLKMDIEGAESAVLASIQSYFPKIAHLTVEFHQTKKHPLEPLKKLLEQHYSLMEIEKDKRTEKQKTNQLFLITATR